MGGDTVTDALRFHDLTLGYDLHPAVHHLDGSVHEGALLALVGPNGAGKSTLLRGIMGFIKPLAGTIERGGLSPREIAYLPQVAAVDWSFPLSVFDFVSMGLWQRAGLFRSMSGSDHARVTAALNTVGLTGFSGRIIGTLSGGQMQRMVFARLLLQDARVILLDEPFNAVDARTTADLIEVIQIWHREKRTVIAALHDFDIVRRVFPVTLMLAREPIAWGPTSEVLTDANLARARHMSEAFDETAAACDHDEVA